MSAPAQKNETDRIERNRRNKAARYLGRFLDQMRNTSVVRPELDKAALTTALATVRAATPEQWRKLADDLTRENTERGFPKKENPPSPDTFAVIVAQLEALIANVEKAQAAARAHEERQAKEDEELFAELLRQRRDPDMHEAREAATERKR